MQKIFTHWWLFFFGLLLFLLLIYTGIKLFQFLLNILCIFFVFLVESGWLDTKASPCFLSKQNHLTHLHFQRAFFLHHTAPPIPGIAKSVSAPRWFDSLFTSAQFRPHVWKMINVAHGEKSAQAAGKNWALTDSRARARAPTYPAAFRQNV